MFAILAEGSNLCCYIQFVALPSICIHPLFEWANWVLGSQIIYCPSVPQGTLAREGHEYMSSLFHINLVGIVMRDWWQPLRKQWTAMDKQPSKKGKEHGVIAFRVISHFLKRGFREGSTRGSNGFAISCPFFVHVHLEVLWTLNLFKSV